MTTDDDNRRGGRLGRLGRLGRSGADDDLRRRVADLEEGMAECRRLHQRLSEVLDVMVEVLVPAVDRDEDRLRAALERLDATR